MQTIAVAPGGGIGKPLSLGIQQADFVVSDMRDNWVRVRLAPFGQAQMEEFVLDAWCMCVPKSVAAAFGHRL